MMHGFAAVLHGLAAAPAPGRRAADVRQFLVHWRGAGRGDSVFGRALRGYSSVGRALAWHARGLGFESP